MDFRKQQLSIEDVKERDMVNHLSTMGFEPVKIRGNDYWYLSPLREEKTASFKVNRKLNRWFDHGIGEGGNLLDFGILFFGCSVKEILFKFDSDLSFHQPVYRPLTAEIPNGRITILRDFSIRSLSLLKYLEERKIPSELANHFCREVRFVLNEKTYYAIGFKNDAGGYEISNSFLKLSSSPKGITSIKIGAGEVAVFEGFFDFLSYLALKNTEQLQQDFLILNSLSFFEKAQALMESYELIRLFLDNDKSGQSCSKRATAWSAKYSDESSLYKGYKDLNEWLINIKDGQTTNKVII
ncbi:MAG TPA: toprim domain-containing protein [Pedobacter sp.]|jgi:hypothetical protein